MLCEEPSAAVAAARQKSARSAGTVPVAVCVYHVPLLLSVDGEESQESTSQIWISLRLTWFASSVSL